LREQWDDAPPVQVAHVLLQRREPLESIQSGHSHRTSAPSKPLILLRLYCVANFLQIV